MQFVKESLIKAEAQRVFAFHELPDAFERLMPPDDGAVILQKADISVIGSRAIIEMKILGVFPVKWIAEHTKYEPPRMFEDVQISGPFRSWRHDHIITPHESGAILRDEVHFEPPLGFLGAPFVPFLVTPQLEKMFAYRHQVTKDWCEKGE